MPRRIDPRKANLWALASSGRPFFFFYSLMPTGQLGDSRKMSKGNWLKLHRSTLEWEWYSEVNVCRLFFHLLLRANYKPSKYKGHEIPIGSIVSGRDALAEQTGLSVMQVRTALDKLKSTQEITITKTSKFSIIAINKWKDYQGDNHKITEDQPQDNQGLTSDQPSSNHQITTSKEGKKESMVKKGEGEETKPPTPQGGTKRKRKPTAKEIRAEYEKQFGDDFKPFWEQALECKRTEDKVGPIRDKYLDLRAEHGFTSEDLLEFIRLHELRNRGSNRPLGVNGAMTALDVRDLLDHPEQVESKARKKTAFENFLGSGFGSDSKEITVEGKTIKDELPELYPPQEIT